MLKNKKSSRTKKLIYNEKYHNNCHDYLKPFYLERYAVPKYKKLLYEIKDKIPKLDICREMPIDLYADTIVCDQHAVIFGQAEDIYPVLATYALNACVGLIMYVPEFNVAALAHIDGLPGYSKESAKSDGIKIDFDPVQENIKMILAYIRDLCETDKPILIEYYLVGGIFELSEIMINDIIDCISNMGKKEEYQFEFKGRNLLGPENQSRNIGLDTKTGKIFYFDYITNSEMYANFRNKDNLPANIIKANRESELLLDVTYFPHK